VTLASKDPVLNKDLVLKAGSSSYTPSHSIYFDLCRSYLTLFWWGDSGFSDCDSYICLTSDFPFPSLALNRSTPLNTELFPDWHAFDLGCHSFYLEWLFAACKRALLGSLKSLINKLQEELTKSFDSLMAESVTVKNRSERSLEYSKSMLLSEGDCRV